ncbi:energy-coupling factor transporter transmembrane protein EcfT [Haemophilus parahaemolyticus]|uniref:Energy-coupling factor transporter transmembrane protein EcfT n=2 Tax=Haemophilus parahaemolyticus TaxID=735 RepID=A0AAE6MPF5_HAEPH|nr:energy-coupling factor transporter transmembrane component T [Haemophilus parahaemolyticus]EIJ70222.1 cobalt transport protein [Haemophilus parahaemolyticus HK385]OOR94950.1 ABC transporter permease [Haemophilus parahaemolyticus]QEN10953.1 energy-coupling factor transporter transmembrane protein EcfT [Haemophilus parahaemolyticus]QRP12144.1 energy-coupling factor transporter transmembrane protein EcfT [Haemophilus parahaemolyticus]
MNKWLEPHYRLAYACLFGIIVSSLTSVKLLAILTACALFVVCFLHSHQPKHLLKRWLKFNLFSVLLWATLSWKIGEQDIMWNVHGIELATLITLRMNLIVLSVWLFLHHVTDTLLVQAIAKLPLPTKLIHLFILSVRYISLLAELNQKMDMAMKARGFHPKFNLFTMKVYAQRVALLLIHSMLKAEKAEIAMKARGFKL